MFSQLLPVVKGGNRADIVSACLKSSLLWAHFEQATLSTNVRLSFADSSSLAREYDQWLCSVGDGTISPSENIELPVDKAALIDSKSRTNVMRQAIHWVFGECLEVSFPMSRRLLFWPHLLFCFRAARWKMDLAYFLF